MGKGENVLELFLFQMLGLSCRCREVSSTPARAAGLWLWVGQQQLFLGPVGTQL